MNLLENNRPIMVKEKKWLFITSAGIKINADVNVSLNIHRKFILKAANDVPGNQLVQG